MPGFFVAGLRARLRQVKEIASAPDHHRRMLPTAHSVADLAAEPLLDAQGALDFPPSRYTAYPTRDRFVEAFGPEELQVALRQRANGAVVGGRAPLALRVQVPAGCRSSRAGSYLRALGSEMSLVAAALGPARTVSRLSLTGAGLLGLSRAEIARLVDRLRLSFRLELGLPMRVEVDTRALVEGRLAHLRQFGCNELLVDLPDAVPGQAGDGLATLARLVGAAHRLDFTAAGVRVPLGACRHAAPAWAALLQRLVDARADRLSLLASGKAADGIGDRRPLAADAAAQRRALFDDAIELLGEHGYAHLGLGQFALRSDVLAVARAQGRLFVDLDGLHDHPCADLIGLGAGAAGQVGATYYQNAVDVADYEAALAAGQLPVARGLALTRDDLARRSVIQALVCQGRLDFESIRLAHLIDPKTYFAPELGEMSRLVRAGLASMDSEAIELTPAGCRRASAVAAVFDRHLRDQARRNQCATRL